ncbi:MAG: FHA domain-containing protein [Candidatus Eisenbacteria bacterium]
MSEPSVVKLRLSLMGRPVRNYTFDKTVISIGRDPGADIFVDNPGVSRDHFRLERLDNGEYQVVDLGSANGTFLNDQMVNSAHVGNNDVVRFGKYTLWVGYEQDRRTLNETSRRANTDTEQHTMILSRSELGNLLDVAKEKDAVSPSASHLIAAAPAMPVAVAPAAPSAMAGLIVAFLMGAALGAAAMFLIIQR